MSHFFISEVKVYVTLKKIWLVRKEKYRIGLAKKLPKIKNRLYKSSYEWPIKGDSDGIKFPFLEIYVTQGYTRDWIRETEILVCYELKI